MTNALLDRPHGIIILPSERIRGEGTYHYECHGCNLPIISPISEVALLLAVQKSYGRAIKQVLPVCMACMGMLQALNEYDRRKPKRPI